MTGRVVVGVDGSEQSHVAVAWAFEEAKLRDCTVDAVFAWATPWDYWEGALPMETHGMAEARARVVADELGRVGVPEGLVVTTKLVNDLPAHALIACSKGAELLVVGSRGRGGFAGLLLGSVSQHVVHHAPCPVVVVPNATQMQEREQSVLGEPGV